MLKRIFLVLVIFIQSIALSAQSEIQKAYDDSIAFLRESHKCKQLGLDNLTASTPGTHLRIWLPAQVLDLVITDENHVSGVLIDFVYMQPSRRIQKKKPWKLTYYSRETTIDPAIAAKIYNEFLNRKVLNFPESREPGNKVTAQFVTNDAMSERTFSPTGGRTAASFYAFLEQTLNLSDSFKELVKRLSPGTYCVGVMEKITISPSRINIPEENDWYDYEQGGYD